MSQFPVKRHAPFFKKFPCRSKDLAKIIMDDLAAVRVYHIVKASSLMHSQAERAVFVLVSKGKFHLISVALYDRTGLDPLELIGAVFYYSIQKGLDLPFLDVQLLLVRNGLVQTAAACSEMAAGIFCRLQR